MVAEVNLRVVDIIPQLRFLTFLGGMLGVLFVFMFPRENLRY